MKWNDILPVWARTRNPDAEIPFLKRFNLKDPADRELLEIINSQKSKSGVKVTEESALTFSAVWSCVRLISENIASLPFNIYQEGQSGRELAKGHRQYYLLKKEPHPYYTAQTLFKQLTMNLLLWGNGYAEIIRSEEDNSPLSYNLLEPQHMEIWSNDEEFFYKYKGRIIRPFDMIHVRGIGDKISGQSPVEANREAIGMGIASTVFGAYFFDNATHLGGWIQSEGRANPEQIQSYRKNFKMVYGGLANAGNVAVLTHGAKFHPFSMPLRDYQFLEGRRFSSVEVCMMFNVDPSKIGIHEGTTSYNSQEQTNIAFVENCIRPIAVIFEQEFDRKIFSEKEKRKSLMYSKFELKGLLRGDVATRFTTYEKMIDRGVYSPNEVRGLEDQPPYPGGDERFIAGHMIPLSKIDEIIANRMAEYLKPRNQA